MSRPGASILAFLLAGREGNLFSLSADRYKPATLPNGRHRPANLVLNNLANSGVGHACVLAQYKSQEWIDHVAPSETMASARQLHDQQRFHVSQTGIVVLPAWHYPCQP